MTTNTPQDTATDFHHGFRLTKVKRFVSRGGTGFSGTLTHHGKPVAEVHQEGNGGQAVVHFNDGRGGDGSRAFEDAARAIFGAESFEPTEALLWRLETAEQMSRYRSTPFVLAAAEVDAFWGDAFWGDAPLRSGQFRQVRGCSPADLPTYLQERYGDAPLVWSKAHATFVPLTSL
ncbi:hypothetical protein CHO01_22870 [Cellulomonas hominis]|uniref:Uncharacterized protein YheU (UPF0270 family) n=1 Tax=Cellulomonas hominis TaxID=156981 RepID=A0A511FD67_9CELL|nr:hypothetical protein [Cellulomonas hominis]MBB5474617.1 uncharacterized protein YheU (UPF0270 family) [Cellulomonas hominis]NKY05490.1 hypothetical protein [Cellulomonas hominis]GEL47171.1 hypothetical protein CHO01_22870 [Cellulomonas hominis]